RFDWSQSAVHSPLKRVVNAPVKAFIRHLGRPLPSTQQSPNGSFLTPPAAAATVARDSPTPRAATTHGRSTQPPSRAYTAATPWPIPSRWWAKVRRALGANWHGATQSYDTLGRAPAAGASRPRPYMLSHCAARSRRPADAGSD